METQQEQKVTVMPRKRSKESVNSTQSEVPTAKRKKLAPKDKDVARPAKRLLSADPASSLQPTPTLSPSQDAGVVTPSPRPAGEEASAESQASSTAAPTATTKRRPPKNWYLKPQRSSPGSWMAHMASVLVHRCAQRADACGLDPRSHLNDISWSKMVDGLLLPQDLHLIWYFIRREYSENSIPQILDMTRPYTELTVDTLLREEIRIKYKDMLPKYPLSPYMLFMKSKQPKLKQKYPNLQMTEVAAKIGKKWSALPQEKKDKYKQQHTLLKAAYEAKLKAFYDEHPDARPPPKQPKPKKVSKSAGAAAAPVVNIETEEERRIKELKAQLPKHPLSAYLHFCKKKREKLHRKYPELPPNAVTVKLGKRWKSMDTEARSKYTKLHEESVKQYKEELEQFNIAHPDAQEILAKAKKKRKTKTSAKQKTLSVGEDGKVTASASPPLPPSLSESATPTITGGKEEEEEEVVDEVQEGEGEVEEEDEAEEEEEEEEEEGEEEEEEEEEEGEEEGEEETAQRESANHQNGETGHSSNSESEDSSTED